MWLERSNEPLCGALSKVQYPDRRTDEKANALSKAIARRSSGEGLLCPGGQLHLTDVINPTNAPSSTMTMGWQVIAQPLPV